MSAETGRVRARSMARFLSYCGRAACSLPARPPAYLPGVRQARAVEGHVQEEAHALAALGGLLGLQTVDDLGEDEELGDRVTDPQEGVVVGVGRVEAGLVAERVVHVGLRQPGDATVRRRSGTEITYLNRTLAFALHFGL